MTPSNDQAIADREKFRRLNRDIARIVAPGWERQRARIEEGVAPLRAWLVRELAPREGDTLLELAAGAGDTGFDAAAIAGESGRLISTDFSPEMVEVARRRGAERAVANVEYRVMDAERLELASASVDGVLCRFGYMLMPHPAAALAETRRVLRPGRHLALAVWGAPERNPWMTILAATLFEQGHLQPPDPAMPTPFSLASEDRTRGLLQDAGFTEIRLEELPIHFAFRDIDDYAAYATDTGGPFALILKGLSPDALATLKATLEQAFRPFASEQGYKLPGLALAGVAS
jgi:ubiquinone/menaquinone biosynthesis C-methylase UbiE